MWSTEQCPSQSCWRSFPIIADGHLRWRAKVYIEIEEESRAKNGGLQSALCDIPVYNTDLRMMQAIEILIIFYYHYIHTLTRILRTTCEIGTYHLPWRDIHDTSCHSWRFQNHNQISYDRYHHLWQSKIKLDHTWITLDKRTKKFSIRALLPEHQSTLIPHFWGKFQRNGNLWHMLWTFVKHWFPPVSNSRELRLQLNRSTSSSAPMSCPIKYLHYDVGVLQEPELFLVMK